MLANAQLPDLTVTNLSWSGQAVAGQNLAISWAVTNTGAGFANGFWYDRLVLSSNATLSGTIASWRWEAFHNTPALGGGYVESRTVTLPGVLAGTYYFIIESDRYDATYNEVAESNETNNSQVVSAVLLLPDLTVTNLSWSGQAVAGQNLAISWAVTNTGAGFANGFWYDRLVLSSNATLSGTIASWRWEAFHNTPALGGGYVESRTVTLPGVLAGTYYFIIESDRYDATYNEVAESNETNNSQVVLLTLGTTDLSVMNLALGGIATAGRNLAVSWTVKNQSTNAFATYWYDRLTLSSNVTLSGVIQSWEFYGYHSVPSGGNYSQNQTVLVSAIPAGTYYLIAEADSQDFVPESNETNNTQTLQITVTNIPPAVTLLTPTNDIHWIICGPAHLKLSAQTQLGSYAIRRVEYYDDGVPMPIGQSTNAPYRVTSLGLTQGVHHIRAEVEDVMGLRSISSNQVQVTLTWPRLHELHAELDINGVFVGCCGVLLGSNYVVETTANLQSSNTLWQTYLVTNQVTWTNLVFTNQPVELQRYFRTRFWP